MTTNTINGRKYIGKHCSSKFDPNYKGSGKLVKQAFTKYGYDNFNVELIAEASDENHLSMLEEHYINKYDAVRSNEFYNLAPGGKGGGWKSNGRSIREGIPMDDTCRSHVSFGHIRCKQAMSPEYIKKLSSRMKGSNNYFYNRELPEDTKLRLRKIRKLHKYINNGLERTKVMNYQLDLYLSKGWVYGRKLTDHYYINSDDIGKILIHKGTKEVLLSDNEFNLYKDYYYKEGYKAGRSKELLEQVINTVQL